MVTRKAATGGTDETDEAAELSVGLNSQHELVAENKHRWRNTLNTCLNVYSINASDECVDAKTDTYTQVMSDHGND